MGLQAAAGPNAASAPPASRATSRCASSTAPPSPTSTRLSSTASPLATGSPRGYPLCLVGDSGTGRSHLLIGLGTAAAMAGCRVRCSAASLVNELVEAAGDKQLGKTIARYGRVDLLEIDELGCLELDCRGAEMLFQVLTGREEKNGIAIASDEAFTGWSKTFTDPRLCAAIVDRLTFNASLVETGTESCRLARTMANKTNGLR